METNYSVDFFIAKFKAIPEHLWLVYAQGKAECKGTEPHCAMGWCRNEQGRYGSANHAENQFGFSLEAVALINLLKPLRSETIYLGTYITEINNGDHPRYQQPTPKQRILAALHDIKAMQTPKEEPTKVVYKTVVIDTKVKELTETELSQQ